MRYQGAKLQASVNIVALFTMHSHRLLFFARAGRCYPQFDPQMCSDALFNYWVSGLARLLLDAVSQFGYLVVNRVLFGHELADLAVRVHDRRMVPVAELLADLR